MGDFLYNLKKWVVRSPNEIYRLLKRGDVVRATGTTKMNELSSRSHAVFIIIVEQMIKLGNSPKTADPADGKFLYWQSN